MTSPLAIFNGQPAPDLAFHRGLHYGDGVFRTCLIYDGQLIDIEEQCDLALSDAAHLGLSPAPAQDLQHEAARLALGVPRGVLKIMLLRAGTARGYRADGAATDRLLCRYPAPAHAAAAWDRGVSVVRTSFRLATQPELAGIKHLNRLEQVLASRALEPEADEALLSDEAGRPVCGTRTNLFWVQNAALYTPLLERCGVAGHMRRRVLALADALQVEAQVRDGSWDEVESADEIFLTNSLVGIWPVARLGSRNLRAPGPVTKRLMDRLAHPRLVNA